MEIIQYNEAYRDRLIALEKHCFPGDSWEDEIWQDILGDLGPNVIYLAVEGGEVAAFLAIYNWGSEKNFVKITNIGTRENFRGQKLAHRLMETMMAEMRSAGMHAFAGETRVTNYPMQKVFSDFGFQIVETMKGYYENPVEDAYRYEISM